MAEKLLSVGLDVGTTSTQLIVSEIKVQNRSSGFAVPEMDITGRKILYESQVAFTPLVGENRVDGESIARWVEEEYEIAGISPAQVDTGAVIVTGETSRKENAGAVLQALSGLAGDFVVATAGPDLESVLAAKGAGAVEFSEKTGRRVLHFDIGGGTSNLALIEDGKIVATGCLNVGGRLVKVEGGRISYVSPVLEGLWHKAGYEERIATPLRPQACFEHNRREAAALGARCRGLVRNDVDFRQACVKVGEKADAGKIEVLAQVLVQALEMVAGLRDVTELLDKLWTRECASYGERIATPACGLVRNDVDFKEDAGEMVISFSGGVADCIEKDIDAFAFGDMGPILGRAIRKSRLCRGEYMLGKQTIRATVIGAGCHSAQLSGSTVFCQNAALPMKNLPVAVVSESEQLDPRVIARRLAQTDGGQAVLAIPGFYAASYEQVGQLADAIAEGFGNRDILVCAQQDLAKALGQRLALLLGQQAVCLCIDRVRLTEGSFLDVGKPMGPCMPVVVKTLIFNG